MRVTNSYIANNLIKTIQNNLSRLSRTQEQLATGKGMLRLSDQPGNLGPLLSIKATLSYFEQYNRNLDDGLGYLYLNDSTMQTLGDILHQSGEMAVQGSNGTYTVEDMAALGEQIDKMIDHVMDLANTSVGRRYIFAGTKNSIAPFHRDGDRIIYTGNLSGIFREVLSGEDYRIDAPGITTGFQVVPLVSANAALPQVIQRPIPDKLINTGMITVTRSGLDTFSITNQTTLDGVTHAPNLAKDFSVADNIITINSADDDFEGLQIDMTGTAIGDQFKIIVDNQLGIYGHGKEIAPGVFEVYNPIAPKSNAVDRGIFDALFELRNRLNAGDSSGVNTSIGEISNKTDQLLHRRVGIGSRTRHFEALKDQILEMEVKLSGIKSSLEDADVYKLSITMSQEQVTLQASLASGAKMLQVSLLDFLK